MNAPQHPIQPDPAFSASAILLAMRAVKFLAIACCTLALADLALAVSLLLHIVGANHR